jgi:hypothetical protein
MKKLAIALTSALIGFGTLVTLPVAAQADGYYFSRGSEHADRSSQFRQRHDRNYDRRNRRACSERMAVEKARDMGIRHARVGRVGRRTIEVTGQRWNRRVAVRFTRAPGCPVAG